MGRIVEMTLDVTKPHRPDIIKFADWLSKVDGVEEVEIVSIELDMETENIKVLIKGKNLDFGKIKKAIEEIGGAIQSVDGVKIVK